MRRLPIFLLLDVSESMAGDGLRQLQQGIERLVAGLRRDPHALESVFLSAIAFAGRARTLAPLTELASFYPPRLPLGSGTSLGAGMGHLMDEIDRNVVGSTRERKGDWRPVVYLMTDGKPTDDIDAAVARWQAQYAARVTLVAIAIGAHASSAALLRFTDNVLALDATAEQDFKRFVDWVTMSVVAQSRAVSDTSGGRVSLAKLDDAGLTSVMAKIGDMAQATTVDEDLVVVTGRCQNLRLPYLMKYEKVRHGLDEQAMKMRVDLYHLRSVFALEADYDELSDPRAIARTVNSDALIGSPGCPHCGNPIAFAMCSCGALMCIKGDGPATCPTCHNPCNFVGGDGPGFDVVRARG